MNRFFILLTVLLYAGMTEAHAQAAQGKTKTPPTKREALFIGAGSSSVSWLPKTEMLPKADDIEKQAGKLSSRLRNIDPFGLSTFPREDDSPIIEDNIYRETPKITLNQALQTLKINGVNLHRKEFLIGGRQAGEGDVVELSFKGEIFQAQVTEVAATQLLFRDLQRDETGVLKHDLIPQLAMEPLQKAVTQFEGRMTPMEPASPEKP